MRPPHPALLLALLAPLLARCAPTLIPQTPSLSPTAPSPSPAISNPSPTAAPAASAPVSLVLDRAGPEIFPEAWRTPRINASAEPLPADLVAPTRDLLTRALAKYPAPLLAANLRAVHAVAVLRYSGISAGGTNSRDAVYLVNNARFAPADVERIFHAELSSILLRNFAARFDKARWTASNPEGWSYPDDGGVDAVKAARASTRGAEALYEQGFLHQYATSDLENDFNAYASSLFMGDAALWEAVEKHPRVKAKADLAIAFYESLDPSLNRDHFLALAPPPSKQSSPPSKQASPPATGVRP